MSDKLPRAVELIRVSTEAQAEKETPELQRRALDRLRESRPCVIVERVEALGVSGALGAADRADLRKLAELSHAKAYDELRVWSVDRLTRAQDPRERVAIYGMALDANAVIVDCSGKVIDPRDASGIGELDWYLQTFFASRERLKIIERTRAGRQRAAQDGRLSQGQPPYGRRYDRESRSWVLVPEQAEVYRRIVAQAIAGQSTRDIAAALNRDGLAPTRGLSWGHSTIKRLLRTEAIVGRYRTCGEVTQIPPIVDEVTWARAKASVARSRSCCGPVMQREAMLRGVLACGVCGMRAHVISDGAGKSHRYGCPQPSRRSEPCSDRRTIRVPAADEAVRAMLVDALTAPDVLRAAVEAGMERHADKSAGADLGAADAELARLEGQEVRLLRLMDDGLISEQVARGRLAQIRAARDAATTARQRALAAVEDTPADASGPEVGAAAVRLGRAIKAASVGRMQELLSILVPARQPFGLWLRRDGIEMCGRLPLDGLARRLGQSSLRCDHRRRR